MKTIKLKKDLPGCPAGTELDLTTDGWLYIPLTETDNFSLQISPSAIKSHPDFFEIIEEPKFKVGDFIKNMGNAPFGHSDIEKIRTEEELNDFLRNPPELMKYFRLATKAEIKQATEKNDVLATKTNGEIMTHTMRITHDFIFFRFLPGIDEIPISELKRIISIAENLQEK